MNTSDANLKQMGHKFDRSLALLAEQDAGKRLRDEDAPMNDLLGVFSEVAFNPIKNDQQLELLHKSIVFFMKEGREGSKSSPFKGTVDDAIDAALDDAIRCAGSTLDTAILALVRHQIVQQRKQAPNA